MSAGSNIEEFVIDLKDFFSKKFSTAVSANDKATDHIKKNITSIQDTAFSVSKRVDEAMSRINRSIEANVQKALSRKVTNSGNAIQEALLGINGASSASSGGVFRSLIRPTFNYSSINSSIAGGLRGVASVAGDTLGAGLAGAGATALIGGVAAIGSITAAFGLLESKIGKTAIEYERFESLFMNTLGDRGDAKRLLKDLGEYAPALGLTFSELSKRMADFQTGNKKAFEDIGLQLEKHKGKTYAIFKGEKKEIDASVRGLTDYIVNLAKTGNVVTGLTRSYADYHNNIELIWHNLAERFNPQIRASGSFLTTLTKGIAKFVEVPLSETFQNEANELRALKAELNDTNISTSRRKEIIDQINEQYGSYLGKLNLEKASYEEINKSLDKTIELLDKKATKARLDQILGESQAEFDSAISARTVAVNEIYKLGNKYAKDVMSMQGLSTEERVSLILAQVRKKGNELDRNAASLHGQGFHFFQSEIQKRGDALKQTRSEIEQQIKDEGLGSLDTGTKSGYGGKPSKSVGSEVNSVSGGGSVRNINISINNLVGGGITIQSTSLKEGATRAKDIVVEALLTAVNDANYAGD